LAIAAANALAVELVLHPWIAAMREETTSRGAWFAVAHGASSLLFLVNCLLAVVILLRRWKDTRASH
jgi:hypothetical protein